MSEHHDADTRGVGLAPSAIAGAEAVGIRIGADTVPETPEGSRRGKGLGLVGWLALSWLVLIVLLALLAPLLPLHDPLEQFRGLSSAPPQADHPFGTDSLGRDMLSRIIYGARASLAVGFGAVLFGFVFGGTLGLLTGFLRGKTDAIVTPLMSILLAIPQFVLALSLVTVLAASAEVSDTRRIMVVILGLGITSIPILGRITRANTLAWSEREFVVAAEAVGANKWRVMMRTVLPNVIPAMLSIAMLGVGLAIIAEGGLSVFGVGVQLPQPSWGNIISEGRGQLRQAPHIVLITTAFLFLTVLALNFLGDAISKRFDVREAQL